MCRFMCGHTPSNTIKISLLLLLSSCSRPFFVFMSVSFYWLPHTHTRSETHSAASIEITLHNLLQEFLRLIFSISCNYIAEKRQAQFGLETEKYYSDSRITVGGKNLRIENRNDDMCFIILVFWLF